MEMLCGHLYWSVAKTCLKTCSVEQRSWCLGWQTGSCQTFFIVGPAHVCVASKRWTKYLPIQRDAKSDTRGHSAKQGAILEVPHGNDFWHRSESLKYHLRWNNFSCPIGASIVIKKLQFPTHAPKDIWGPGNSVRVFRCLEPNMLFVRLVTRRVSMTRFWPQEVYGLLATNPRPVADAKHLAQEVGHFWVGWDHVVP